MVYYLNFKHRLETKTRMLSLGFSTVSLDATALRSHLTGGDNRLSR
ncbi:hypothetical protein SPONN_1017 [uncultured Candidatus Thioglobus sp.]|nr:hypothetical protein SPONN_1017 [uncultured Candidatus Thioglobus sp.]